jgi:hypothetical protein
MEQVICSNKDLASIDRAIAAAYKAALAKLGPLGRKYLVQDQKDFVAVRDGAYDRVYGVADGSDQKRMLLHWLKWRIKLLRNISYSRPRGFVETATPLFGTFVYEAHAVGAIAGGALKATADNEPGVQISLTREGDVLRVEVARLSKSEDFDTSPFCGRGSRLGGSF